MNELRKQFEKDTGKNAVELDSAGVRSCDRPSIDYVEWLEQRLEGKNPLETLVRCANCGSANIGSGENKTTVDVDATGNYRQVVFRNCQDCGECYEVELFD
jgi:hypothetical protein